MPGSAQYYPSVYGQRPVEREEQLAAAESASEQQQQQQQQHCQWLPTLQLVDRRRCLGTIRHVTDIKRHPLHVPPNRLERRSPRRCYKAKEKRFVSVERR